MSWRKYLKKRNRHNRRKLRRLSRHHLKNRCRGGDCSAENLLILTREHHDLWHRLFKNSDPEYIIEVLNRLIRMKNYRTDRRKS